jgi:hypothetical protein
MKDVKRNGRGSGTKKRRKLQEDGSVWGDSSTGWTNVSAESADGLGANATGKKKEQKCVVM